MNVALVIALGFGLHRVQVETEREARAEAAIVEASNLVSLCHHAARALGQYSIALNSNFCESCQQDEVLIPLSLQRLQSLVSDSPELVETMDQVRNLVSRDSQLLRDVRYRIENKVYFSCSVGFSARHMYKQIWHVEAELQAEIKGLNLQEAAAQSHRARDLASQFVRLTLTFAVLFNGAMVLRAAFAVIRPRPLFPLVHFR